MLHKMLDDPMQCHKCGAFYDFDEGESCPKCETKPNGQEYNDGSDAVEDYIDSQRDE